jgi:hypothetical protein
LVEQQSTNLALYSSDFSNAAWSKDAATVSANSIIAPDGTLTADAFVENTGNVLPAIYVGTGISLTSGTTYTGSVYLKANGRNFVAVYFQTANFPDSGRIAWFNLSTQATQFQSGVTGTITSVGNNWYRCTITATADATGSTSPNALGILITTALGSTSSYTGDGYSGIYIWGAQLEALAFPTSYIPTVASQVTRAADSASMTGTNFSSWFNNAEGTVYVEVNSGGTNSALDGSGTGRGMAVISDGTASNMLRIGSSLQSYVVTTSGVTQASMNPVVGIDSNTTYKFNAVYQTNYFQASRNGILATEDTSGVVPAGLNTLAFGRSFGTSAGVLNGTIKKLSYYPIRLSNTNLVALTS